MNKVLNPNVTVTIAGQSHQIRWDKAALYELGAFPEAKAEVDVENGAALWRCACIYLFCMLQGEHKFKTPKDIAVMVAEEETEGLMAAINEAIMAGNGGKDSTDDPLSKNGHSQGEGSD